MDLSIIIASWNVKQYLRQCLRSIYHYTQNISFEVIVIDNASHDGSVDMVTNEFPQVRLICNTQNYGFGAANNQGLAQAQGKYILFLNDDTEIKSNIFQVLVDKYNTTTDKIGMMGCRLLNNDGSQQYSVRAFPQVKDQTIILLKLHHLFPKLLDHYWQKKFNYDQEQTVEQIMGAFMFMPKALLDQYNSFDPAFFNWFEEVDLQQRLVKAGYKILYTPIVSCIHIKGPSFAQLARPAAQRMFNRSMRTYFRKHHSRLSYWWIYALNPISLTLAYVLQGVR